jgi:multiple sugar transport system permease protein
MAAFIRGAWLPLILIALIAAWIALERPPASRPGQVTLRWVINSQERDVQFAEAIRTAFEAKNPRIHIEFVKQNEGRKEDTMIAGGDAPDVLQIGLDKLPFYVQAGVFWDLRRLLYHKRYDTHDDPLDPFFPICRQAFEREGHLYAMPWGYVPFIVFYNRSLFDKHAVPYPKDGWTWSDYERAAKALTNDTDGDGIPDEFGASFAQWHDGYYCWFAQNGGRVLSVDGQRATFDDPKVVEAIAFLQRLTREDKVMPTAANRPKQTGLGLFEAGKLAIQGPTGSFYIPTYRDYKNLDWDIASAPTGPQGKGTIIAPQGYAITTQSKHPGEAFAFILFLCSEEGQRILATSGLFVPARKSVAFSDEFLKAPGAPANKYALVSMMDDRDGKQPWAVLPPSAGTRWGDVNDEALSPNLNRLLFGRPKPGETPETVVKQTNARANEILEDARKQMQGQPMPWKPLSLVGTCIVVAGLVMWALDLSRFAGKSKRKRVEQRWGYTAIAPWMIGFLILTAGPLLFSLLMSFTRWDSLSPASQARWVGFENYAWALGGSDELFRKSLLATVKFAVLSVPLHLVFGLALAMLMNVRLPGVSLFRTLYYLPAVMPLVASAALFNWIFRQQGLLNYVMGGFGAVPFNRMPDWLGDPSWTVPSIVVMGLWSVGGGMMIYLAGLQNIPTQLYEAAQIDGAGWWKQFQVVTLPMLSPTLFFNLVMGIIGAFQVFTSAFVLFSGSAGPDDSALFYSFYLYRKAFEQFQVGYGSALAWILFAIILALSGLVFRSSSLWVYYEGSKEGRATS